MESLVNVDLEESGDPFTRIESPASEVDDIWLLFLLLTPSRLQGTLEPNYKETLKKKFVSHAKALGGNRAISSYMSESVYDG